MTTLPNTKPSAAATKAIEAALPVVPMVAKPNAEIAAITKAIIGAFDEYAEPGLAVNEATEASKAANAAAEGTRERLMKRMCAVADKAGWNNPANLEEASKLAVTQWAEGKNRLPSTLAQLRVELFRAMHPSARPYVTDAFEDAKVSWREEREAVAEAKAAIDAAKADGVKKDDLPPPAEAPLMKTFAKSYHMVAGNKGILQAHIDADDPKCAAITSHEEAADPHMLAETRNGVVRRDPKVAARTLAKLVETIEAIYAEFPAASLATMANFARNLNAKALEDAKVMARAKAEVAAKRNAAPSTTPRKARNAIDEAVGDAADDIIG